LQNTEHKKYSFQGHGLQQTHAEETSGKNEEAKLQGEFFSKKARPLGKKQAPRPPPPARKILGFRKQPSLTSKGIQLLLSAANSFLRPFSAPPLCLSSIDRSRSRPLPLLSALSQEMVLRLLLAMPRPRAVRCLLLADLAVLGVEGLLAPGAAPLGNPQDLPQEIVALHLGLRRRRGKWGRR